jgi:hypothetical protein
MRSKLEESICDCRNYSRCYECRMRQRNYDNKEPGYIPLAMERDIASQQREKAHFNESFELFDSRNW